MSLKFAVAIPARFGSTRLPGKPLAMIGGRTMLSRVVDVAREAIEGYDGAEIFVATDHVQISDHAAALGVQALMTPESCASGSDRVLAALRQLENWPDFVVNLQGDAPFTPPHVLHQLFEAFAAHPHYEVVTPVHRLRWADLDRLREKKEKSPFSGTSAVVREDGQALWFSKMILPALRGEEKLRSESDFSPVWQHMGLYGFRPDILEQFCRLTQSPYEILEGLEQLRLLENGIKVQTVAVEIEEGMIQSGIDSPEDLARAEEFLSKRA